VTAAANIICLRPGLADAARLGSRLGLPVGEIAVHAFPDGEIRVTVPSISPLTIIYQSLDYPNEKLLALLFATESCRRNGARRLLLVAPYLCYMRQDAAFHRGEAISQKVVGRLLASAFDRIITVNAHLHRTSDIRDVFPGCKAENLSAMGVVASTLHNTGLDPATVVFGPDSESGHMVSELARSLGVSDAVARKIRRADETVEITLPEPSRFAGRPVLLVDDMASSAGTLIACARELINAGATTVDAIIVHALFPAEKMTEITRAGIRSVRSTNSVPHPTNAISLDELLAVALKNEVSAAYGGVSR
jgi:ribose-phosphate pyrophosphokinase